MRKFPKSRAAFQKVVEERGKRLRALAFEELAKLVKPLTDGAVERVIVESCPATIGIIVEPKPDGTLRVVVQGFNEGEVLLRKSRGVGRIL
jgi:hypothetical protein